MIWTNRAFPLPERQTPETSQSIDGDNTIIHFPDIPWPLIDRTWTIDGKAIIGAAIDLKGFAIEGLRSAPIDLHLRLTRGAPKIGGQ